MAELISQYVQQVKDLELQGVIELFLNNSPIVGDLHFIDLGGALVYEWKAETGLGGVGVRQLNSDYQAAAKTSGSAAPMREGTGIVGGAVQIDVQLSNVRATRVAQKMRAAALQFNRLFFKGTAAAGAFDGLYARCTGTEGLTTAGTGNGGYLDLDVLSKMIARMPGQASQKRLFMGYEMQCLLGQVIRANKQAIIAPVEWAGQLTPKTYDGVRIVDVGDDETRALIMTFNETVGQTASCGSIVMATLGGATDGDMVQGLADLGGNGGQMFSVKPRPGGTTYDETLIEGRMGIAVHHDRCLKRYSGLVNAVNPA